MKLTLIRHGEAHPNVIDATRELTDLGHGQAERTAQNLKSSIKPDIFVVSPYTRAQQTLAHLHAYFPHIPVVVCDVITPDDDAQQAIEALQHIETQHNAQHMVVVCHMNVIAYIDELLTAQNIQPFSLAEARSYELSTIAKGLATPIAQYIP